MTTKFIINSSDIADELIMITIYPYKIKYDYKFGMYNKIGINMMTHETYKILGE